MKFLTYDLLQPMLESKKTRNTESNLTYCPTATQVILGPLALWSGRNQQLVATLPPSERLGLFSCNVFVYIGVYEF